jgi:hypothetical protein
MYVRPEPISQPQPSASSEVEKSHQPRPMDLFEKEIPKNISPRTKKSADPRINMGSGVHAEVNALMEKVNGKWGFASGVAVTQVISAPARSMLARVIQVIASKTLVTLAPIAGPVVSLMSATMFPLLLGAVGLAVVLYAGKNALGLLFEPLKKGYDWVMKKTENTVVFLIEQKRKVGELVKEFLASDTGQEIVKLARSVWQGAVCVAKGVGYVLSGVLHALITILDFFIGLPEVICTIFRNIVKKF